LLYKVALENITQSTSVVFSVWYKTYTLHFLKMFFYSEVLLMVKIVWTVMSPLFSALYSTDMKYINTKTDMGKRKGGQTRIRCKINIFFQTIERNNPFQHFPTSPYHDHQPNMI